MRELGSGEKASIGTHPGPTLHYDAGMFRLDEQTQMVATMVRQWCQSQLAPRIPALEHGEEQPFDLMKKMAKAFGFDVMLGGSVQKRIAKLRAGEASDPEKTLAA